MDITQRIAKAKTQLVLNHPFFGFLALSMPTVITDRVPTAGVDGVSLMFNPDWCAKLTDQQLVFLVAHECMHPMLLHNFRCGPRDRRLWNAAGDYVINQHLVDDKIGAFIPGGCLDKQIFDAGHGTSEGVYAYLQQEQQSGAAGGIGLQDVMEGGTATPAQLSQAEAEWKVRVAQAAASARMAGKLSANMARLTNDLVKPKVDWRKVLRDFVEKVRTDERSFARPNRRFIAQGLYLPSVSGETLGEVVFAVDMSGSISNAEADQFGAECRRVHQDSRPERLHMVFFSHDVCAHDVLDRHDEFVFKPRGGGGTAFSTVFRHLRDKGIHPKAIIFLTDLECSDFGDPPECPVLWVTTSATHAPFGQVIEM